MEKLKSPMKQLLSFVSVNVHVISLRGLTKLIIYLIVEFSISKNKIEFFTH